MKSLEDSDIPRLDAEMPCVLFFPLDEDLIGSTLTPRANRRLELGEILLFMFPSSPDRFEEAEAEDIRGCPEFRASTLLVEIEEEVAAGATSETLAVCDGLSADVPKR
mmetsp:Transcript_9423/g.17137  ORF Transcript_9423/g.17137 Transcript_9423/m.17137 type:complete len:108 (-) Transcript_9423:1141-1464(-)